MTPLVNVEIETVYGPLAGSSAIMTELDGYSTAPFIEVVKDNISKSEIYLAVSLPELHLKPKCFPSPELISNVEALQQFLLHSRLC